MMNGHASKVAELANRANDTAFRLDEIYKRRRALALNAAEGDKAAQKTILEIDAAATVLLREQATLIAAVDAAEEIEREQQAEREQQDRAAHEAEANKIAAAALKVSEQIDGAMKALAGLFEKRAALLRDLGKTGTFPTNLAQRYGSRAAGASAAKAAGLDRFVALEFVGAGNVRTLVEASGALRGPLTLPAAPPPSLPRFRPAVGGADELPTAAS